MHYHITKSEPSKASLAIKYTSGNISANSTEEVNKGGITTATKEIILKMSHTKPTSNSGDKMSKSTQAMPKKNQLVSKPGVVPQFKGVDIASICNSKKIIDNILII